MMEALGGSRVGRPDLVLKCLVEQSFPRLRGALLSSPTAVDGDAWNLIRLCESRFIEAENPEDLHGIAYELTEFNEALLVAFGPEQGQKNPLDPCRASENCADLLERHRVMLREIETRTVAVHPLMGTEPRDPILVDRMKFLLRDIFAPPVATDALRGSSLLMVGLCGYQAWSQKGSKLPAWMGDALLEIAGEGAYLIAHLVAALNPEFDADLVPLSDRINIWEQIEVSHSMRTSFPCQGWGYALQKDFQGFDGSQ